MTIWNKRPLTFYPWFWWKTCFPKFSGFFLTLKIFPSFSWNFQDHGNPATDIANSMFQITLFFYHWQHNYTCTSSKINYIMRAIFQIVISLFAGKKRTVTSFNIGTCSSNISWTFLWKWSISLWTSFTSSYNILSCIIKKIYSYTPAVSLPTNLIVID